MHSWAGQVELVISDDRALLNPLAMMKQLAAINKWTGPQQTQQRVPKRAVLEAQVAARQQDARDKVSLVAEAHKEAREGRHAPAPAAAFSDKRVSHYEEQAQTLAVKSKEDIEMALELTAKAQELPSCQDQKSRDPINSGDSEDADFGNNGDSEDADLGNSGDSEDADLDNNGDSENADLGNSYKERGDKERGDKEQGDKERGDKERGDKERGDKERGDKERGDKERGDKERGDKRQSATRAMWICSNAPTSSAVVTVMMAVILLVVTTESEPAPGSKVTQRERTEPDGIRLSAKRDPMTQWERTEPNGRQRTAGILLTTWRSRHKDTGGSREPRTIKEQMSFFEE